MFSRIQMQHMDGLCIFKEFLMKYFLEIFIVCFFQFFQSNVAMAEKASDKSSTIGQFLPPGVILPYAGCKDSTGGTHSCNDSSSKKEGVPEGWLLAYGQPVSRTLYPKLYASIGITYGPGNGSSTFNLPDCRGRAMLGRDTMGGAAAGKITTAISGTTGSTLGDSIGNEGGTATSGENYTISIVSSGSHLHTIQGHIHNSTGRLVTGLNFFPGTPDGSHGHIGGYSVLDTNPSFISSVYGDSYGAHHHPLFMPLGTTGCGTGGTVHIAGTDCKSSFHGLNTAGQYRQVGAKSSSEWQSALNQWKEQTNTIESSVNETMSDIYSLMRNGGSTGNSTAMPTSPYSSSMNWHGDGRHYHTNITFDSNASQGIHSHNLTGYIGSSANESISGDSSINTGTGGVLGSNEANHVHTVSIAGANSSGGKLAFSKIQPSLIVNCIIKY